MLDFDFDAKEASGKIYKILARVGDAVTAQARDGLHVARPPLWLETADGLEVKALGQGRFEIVPLKLIVATDHLMARQIKP
jgi:hypothetical protein